MERERQQIIGLCSKTYHFLGLKDKFSCKGVNKKCNEINKEKYSNVLLTTDGGFEGDYIPKLHEEKLLNKINSAVDMQKTSAYI